MSARPAVPEPGTIAFRIAKAMIGANTWIYRRTGGRMGNKVKGAPVLLLEHVGRKSGKRRTAPVLYLEDGTDLVVVGSRGGSEAMPAWFLNLIANPSTTVQIGSERRDVLARQASQEEKQRLWPRLVEMFPDFDAYQARTSREIPVAILSPTSEPRA
jgi:deazaflavin-dependent oxidoreductase (nitroreductase family)